MTTNETTERSWWIKTLIAALWTLGWVASSAAVVLAYHVFTRPDLVSRQLMVTHGNRTVPHVALTFDDGPTPLWHPLIADTLTRHGARGTFMVVGIKAERYPEIIARLVRAGHEVESHSMTHPYPNLTIDSPVELKTEIGGMKRLLEQLTGEPVPYFRPPGGGISLAVIEEVVRDNQRIAWWSHDEGDSAEEGEGPAPGLIAGDLRDNIRPGMIMLMHGRPHSLAALEAFFATPTAQRYTYETLSSIAKD